ncbi:uncharacterized protein PRCAT00002325001 [Priceomyces carsonii]|uniref:uncharacterized protein n=1 Tax=Priceomyces carsonii TaxID=28549 RepID=UPI002ED78534|nr:unnamed protein product [Priceomyces carsonii]
MSRIIVKGLPKYLTEGKLESHFSQKGQVTDVKLMKKRNGESRRFAFIGYKSAEDAAEAIKYFNKSFIDTARIDVESAKSFSASDVPLPMKEQKKRKEERLQEHEERLLRIEEEQEKRNKKRKTTCSTLDEEIEQNPRLKEFMEVMKPSHLQRTTASDDIMPTREPSANQTNEASSSFNPTNVNIRKDVTMIPENDSDEEYEELKYGKLESEDDEEKDIKEIEKNTPHTGTSEDLNIAADENISDLDWLKLRRHRMKENNPNIEEDSKTQIESIDEDASNNLKQEFRNAEEIPIIKSSEDATVQKISQTGRLFVRNILYSSTEDDFRDLFETFGPLEEVHIAIDTRTGKSKGFVYVQFLDNQNAVTAYQEMDKQIFQGRLLHILAADEKKDHRLDEFDMKNLPLKKQRELKKKQQASKSQFSWNSLYMNTDAVLESVASQMGVAKSDLIDPQNSSSAVKQALAEAHVIGDVRKYFEDRGVDLTAFNKKEREDKIILVKNFPFGTTNEDIGEMFSQYGQLNRILMPPSGTIAIVEFRDLPSARAAFAKLSYRRFNKSILYLEKGPKGLFLKDADPKDETNLPKDSIPKAIEAKVNANDLLFDHNDDENLEGPTVSVFVKNLNFETNSDKLSDLFKSFLGFVVALVKTKPDPHDKSKVQSMGFGFVEFRTKEQAEIAIRTLDGQIFDGHRLQLKLSHRQTTQSKNSNKNLVRSNKLIVKNLPFEATRKDVLELFSAFGQLKSVRVPKKFDRSARGFAFVEFSTSREAETAIDRLQGVHLLGRKLVMNFAEQESEDPDAAITKMTERVKKQMATRELAATRLAGKGKIDIGEEEEDLL